MVKIAYVKMDGFRNFSNATVNFAEKSLVIGANDVGKSNLLHALRVLLDRSMPETEIEPHETDFHIALDGKQSDQLQIEIKLTNITEDAVISRMKGYISDDGEAFIRYVSDRATLAFQLYAGHKLEALEELDGRSYLKHIHFKYVESTRDIHQYIQREKRYLLKTAKANRTDGQEAADAESEANLQAEIAKVNTGINSLSYVSGSTARVNAELKELSVINDDYTVGLEAQSLNFSEFVERLSLSASSAGKKVGLGGDGRNNQILVGLWKAKSEIEHDPEEEAIIYCIEEPEAHLHPHQQRKLADYLVKKLNGQVIVSTHSPQIASEFRPDGIIRLYEKNGDTYVAKNGCSNFLKEPWKDFGYRMSIVPAEAFFADCVLLVEGPSEILFYHELANQLSIDLDYFNVSILSVDGIDFDVYVKILEALEIPWTMRTDNDVFRVPNSNPPMWRLAGMNRARKIAGFKSYKNSSSINRPQKTFPFFDDEYISLAPIGIFLSRIDLENDLGETLGAELMAYTKKPDVAAAVAHMQERKAIRMSSFLGTVPTGLAGLASNALAAPLNHAVEQAKARRTLAKKAAKKVAKKTAKP